MSALDTGRPRLQISRSLLAAVLVLAAGTSAHSQESPAPRTESPLEALDAARAVLAPSGFADGDYDRAVAAILAEVARDPGSPYATALLQRASTWLDRVADRGAALERGAKLLATPGLPGRVRSRLAAMRAEAALRAGDEATLLRSGDLFPGHLARAAAIGPFGDALPGALSLVFEPERGLSLGATARGLGHARTLEWQAIARRPFESHLDLAAAAAPAGGVRYVRAQLRSERARPAYLAVAAPGSIAVSWNGDEVARLDLEVELRRPIPPAPIVLREGWNRLLLKLDGRSAPWASATILDAAGQPIEGLEEEAKLVDHEPAPKPDGLAPPPPYDTAEARLLRLLSSMDPKNPARAEIQALRGVVLSLGDRPSEGLADLRAAAAAAPDRADLAYSLAEGTLAAAYLPESDAKNRAREAVDRALAKDPGHVPALLLRAELLARDDRMEEALGVLDEAAKRAPGLAAIPEGRARIFGKLQWQAERRRALDEAIAKAPRKAELRAEAAREARGAGDAERERRELDEAATLDASNRAVSERRVELWLLASEGAKALSERERWVRWYRRPEDRAALASTLASLGRAEEAIAIERELAAKAPLPAPALLAVAQSARAEGRDEDAKKTYELVLRADPGNEAARRWFREAGGGYESDEFFARYRPDAWKAIREYKLERDHERAPDVLLVDYQAERVLPDGSAEVEVIQVHRVNDARGVEKHGNANFRGELLELRVVHPDGTSDEPTPAKGEYALPNLKPGDFVLVRSRHAEDTEPGARIERGKFSFQSLESPYVFSQYVLALPKEKGLRLAERNFAGEHEVHETDQEVVHVMTQRNSPRILPESNMPSPETFLPWVRAGESYAPEELARSYRANFLRGMELTEEIRQAARDALARAGAKTDREKAAALYAFTNDTLLERAGGSATRALLEKRGNPFGLFGALLRAEGIPFDPALARGVSPQGDDEREPVFLEPSRYGYPLLRVRPRDGGEPLWVDLSMRLQPLGSLAGTLSGSEVFVAGEAGPSVEHLPELADVERAGGNPFPDIRSVARLAGAKEARVDVVLTMHNQGAWANREAIRNATEDVRKATAAQVSNGLVEGIELESYEYPQLDRADQPLGIRFQGRVTNFLREGAGRLEAPVLLRQVPLARMLAGRSKRRLPLRFGQMTYFRERLRLEPGERQSLAEVPSDVAQESGVLSYRLAFRRDGSALEVERTLRISPGIVQPADFPAFLAICRAVEEAEQTKIGIAASPADSSPSAGSRPGNGER